jgi:hypothetical protein
MAALALSAQDVLPYTHFIFANVGADSENPDTLRYIDAVAKPYAQAHGLHIVEVRRILRSGDDAPTLYEDIMSDTSNIPIPAFWGTAPVRRNCTSRWKIKVIERWMKQHAGATKQERKPLGVGISTDESHRMRTDDPEREPYIIKEYPLIDLMMTRHMCQDVITKAGLPLAPKSACWFCPYRPKSEWVQFRRDKSDLFDKAVEVEVRVNEKRAAMGKTPLYLTSYGMPLDKAISLEKVQSISSSAMFADDDSMACESGYCMT